MAALKNKTGASYIWAISYKKKIDSSSISYSGCSASQRSASNAEAQPEPAAVIACLYLWS